MSPESGADSAAELRARILELVVRYTKVQWPAVGFEAGEDLVPVSGKVFDEREVANLVDASLDFWLTTGRYAERFETDFAAWVGVRRCLLVNSGSSANLLAVTSLTSPQLGDRALRAGDEVITCATGFPTTVNPIIQNNLVPVFLDVDPRTYNMDTARLEDAISPRTRAIMLAHTLGNPFDLDRVLEIAKANDLWVIEDSCDAVGARWRGQTVGTFGDLATVSFYPAHHMTMGEGGALLTSSPKLTKIAESFRDWGRDCWCVPGMSNTCGRRFEWQLGELPAGYDHKYIYTHVGYNLKMTDMQAAVGVAQLEKLPAFIEARRANFEYLYERLLPLAQHLQLPESEPHATPSWFGFPITVRPDSRLGRRDLVARLTDAKVDTRLLFGGNIVRQPAYVGVRHRVVGSLDHAERVMNDAFWLGIYPGIGAPQLDHVVDVLTRALTG